MGTLDFVSASAGSGKTHRIVSAVVDALTTGALRPEALVATTFSRRAATSLEEALRARLRALGRDADAVALADARIGTVHGLCAGLLRDFGFMAGRALGARIVEPEVTDELLLATLDDAVSAAELARAETLRERLEDWDLLREAAAIVSLARCHALDRDALLTSTPRHAAELRALLGPAGSTTDLEAAFDRALDALDGRASHPLLVEAREARARAVTPAWSLWLRLSRLDLGADHEALVHPLRMAAAAHLRHPALRADLDEAATLATGLAARSLEPFEAARRRANVLDYVDLETVALTLLRREDVQDALRGELGLVVVDEFQDSSPLQVALLLELANLAPRSLWVGDLKQSIYGFRGAAPDLVERVVRAATRDRPPETLSRSWRSRAPLVELSTGLFTPPFSAQGIDPSAVALTPVAPDSPELGAAIERWRVPDARAQQPTAIARGVRAILDDPAARVRDPGDGTVRRPRPEDVAVLARRHDRCEAIARGLHALGLSCDYARAGLLRAPEVRLALAAMRLLADAEDRLAATEVVRLTADRPDDPTWLRVALARDDTRAASPLVAALCAAGRDRLPPAEAFDLAVIEHGIGARVARWGDVAQRAANLDALRALATRWAARREREGRPPSMPPFLAWLRALEGRGEDLCGRVEHAAVAVLTWHASKGLEWPVVVLADLEEGFDDTDVLGARVCPEEPLPTTEDPLAGRTLRYWPSPYARGDEGAFATFVLRSDAPTRDARAAAERESLRLLYVAWTRARDRVCLAAPTGRLTSGLFGLLRRNGVSLAPEPRLGRAAWLRREWPVVERNLSGKAPDAGAAPREDTVRVPAEPDALAGPHAPLWVRPSALAETGFVLRVYPLGEAHAPQASFDPRRLGAMLHAWFAGTVTPNATAEPARAQEFIDAFGAGRALTAASLVAMSEALRAWIAREAPGAAVLPEHPVWRALPEASVLRGAADLVLVTPREVLVIDHKSHHGADADAKAATHWGQLRAYGEALARAFERPEARCYIHLPLSGRMVQIGAAPAMIASPYHARYLAHCLRLERPQDDVAGLSRSISNAKVDLNPHQIEAALFALRSPFSKGVLLADEVGLGKTIEAGIVLAQKWAEKRRRILLIAPATLRTQWQSELAGKFFIPSEVLETRTFNEAVKKGHANPFVQEGAVVIVSYEFAYRRAADLAAVPWDLVVIDEAHRLRSIYKKPKKATKIVEAIRDRKKVLLTATPLQNSLLELYGLATILDDQLFGSQEAFSAKYVKQEDPEERNTLLRDRIAHVCKRTLRRDVLEYIQFTQRRPITLEFVPSAKEAALYEKVSEYLQRKVLIALPNRQRKLIQMILWKLLASSSRAIGATLAKFVDKLKVLGAGAATAEDVQEVAQDFDAFAETSEEWSEEEDEGPSTQSAFGPGDRGLPNELADLRSYIALAASIGEDEKTRRLKEGLERAFAESARKGGPRKAVIFTESVKTQEYLVEWLSANGYGGKIAVMNGANNDETSKRIYAQWKERHKARWNDVSSRSRAADTKTAIVEEFRSDRVELLIATESAAEGVNLQFCAIVVNYDLPWNPQRVEQRIGRCHRYGQKHDVLVVNFVNMKNEADRRVYELLEQKFQLFEGVFGATDQIIGYLESGVDIEQAIVDIYQTCRTPEEIRAAFDQLQLQVDVKIRSAMADVRQKVLDHFDAEVQRKLDVHHQEARRTLDAHQTALLDLCHHTLGARASFDPKTPRFTLPAGDPDAGTYNLDWRLADAAGEVFFRTDHPLAVRLCDEALRAPTPLTTLRFTWHPSAAPLGAYVGRSGWLRMDVLTLKAVERSAQWILLGACTDDGEVLAEDVAARFFALPARDAGPPPGTPPKAVADALGALRARRVEELNARNQEYFHIEQDKLFFRAEDLKQGLEREIKALDKEIAAMEKELRRERDTRKVLEMQRQLRAVEEKRKDKRRSLYDEQDRLDADRKRLIDELQKSLEVEPPREEPVFTVRWSLTP